MNQGDQYFGGDGQTAPGRAGEQPVHAGDCGVEGGVLRGGWAPQALFTAHCSYRRQVLLQGARRGAVAGEDEPGGVQDQGVSIGGEVSDAHLRCEGEEGLDLRVVGDLRGGGPGFILNELCRRLEELLCEALVGLSREAVHSSPLVDGGRTGNGGQGFSLGRCHNLHIVWKIIPFLTDWQV